MRWILGLGLVAGVGLLYATRKLSGPQAGDLVTVDTKALMDARGKETGLGTLIDIPIPPGMPPDVTMRVTQVSPDGRLLQGFLEDNRLSQDLWGSPMKDVPVSVVHT